MASINSYSLLQVLVTIYWLGKAANSCTSYSGSTLNLKEFEGLLAQMRKVSIFLLCFGNKNLIQMITPINNMFVAKCKRSGGFEYKLLCKSLSPLKMFLTVPNHKHDFLWQPALW